MEQQIKHGMKILQGILTVMLISSFLFFIIGEMLLPAENQEEEGACQILEADWIRLMPDGSSEPMEVPGECEAEKGEWVTVATKLPENQGDTWFCFRSMQQDFKIYVGDQLRKEYSTIDSQPFGKTSTIAYVFVKINDRDAGEMVRVEFMTDSSYAGFLSDVYTGDKAEIWKYFLQMYAPAIIAAMVMFFIGIVVVIGCLVMRFFYKRESEILHLGSAILIASTWLIAESRLRQFIMANSTIAMYLGFYMIMLLPFPFSAYMNIIQKGRYYKAYLIIFICTAVNFIFATVLQVLEMKDFFETMGISHVIIVAMMVFLILTISLDIRKGYIKEYQEVAIGFASLIVAGLVEIYFVYQNSSQYNGIALCVSLVVLLATAGMKSMRDVLEVEHEKQVAIAASESKAKFLANMSHEIRTPINTVIGMNEMILRENQDETIHEYAHNIKSASQMLLGLINDVLDFSKIEAGKLQLSENDYSLSGMLNSVILGIEARAKQKNLELKLEIDETMPSILKGDEIRIKQILNNLLSNAVKYTEKGSITFSAKGIRDEKGFSLLVSVTDTGIGIRQEDMEKLFDSFLRLEMKKNRNVEGTGLGLNITKQLVDNMHGKMDVQSEHGKGSCFTVRIPQQIVDETAMGSLNQKPKFTAPTEKTSKGVLYAPDAKVLVVDDNRTNLKVIEALLKRSKIQLDFATGGNQCLEMTKDKKYDLILMDHMMPDPDGIQTLHMLRDNKDNVNQETTVIVLTANAIAGMEEKYLEEGFADYLSKPVEVGRLEEVLAKYLSNVIEEGAKSP